MNYYSEYTNNYVQDICDVLNNEGLEINAGTSFAKPYSAEAFKNLTELLRNYVTYYPGIFSLLNEKGLVNRGRCPYTGTRIDDSAPFWNYSGRCIYVSKEGAKIMREEGEENYRKAVDL
ncbi:hypothetical protein JW887_03490 [Candidatus Dojkabacteria bacterium]|nr:hypothetical protein [Candidatus Dojkabacteria bacterium]